MADFVLCEACRREYEDPRDRRFHAQPTACPACGPRLWALDARGAAGRGDPVAAAGEVLRRGGVVALKGLGGFHLAADASRDAAVAGLRRRKRHLAKPLAVMVRDRDTAVRAAVVSDDAWRLLAAPEAPIVLCPRREDGPLAPSVAPDTNEVGLFLPYTPLHRLLLAEPGCALLVMTSGNRAEEPICVDNEEARRRLAEIADLFLLHDRPIAARVDDSVLRPGPRGPTFLRRSRGYVPRAVPLSFTPPPVLAMGSLLKNTFCLTRGSEAIPGPHIGDLDGAESLAFFEEALVHLEALLGVTPEILAHDLHPDCPGTGLARERRGVRAVAVQHHHAHVASCLAEHGEAGPVVGLALDGFGLGTDGAAWGGEILVADLAHMERVGHLRPVPLPGGDRAAREPWRMALAHLQAAGAGDRFHGLPVGRRRSPEETRVVRRLLEDPALCPVTTSAGRLFDAVAALCDLGDRVSYEGQAAMKLESLAGPPELERDLAPYPFPLEEGRDGLLLDPRPLVSAVAQDVEAGRPLRTVARRFHRALAHGFAEGASRAARGRALDTVALSGGCFQNRFLLVETLDQLRSRGLRVLWHEKVPPNDGGLSLGQAAVAGWRALVESRGEAAPGGTAP
jgi:hydrogenase maturation protein HypF